MIPLLKFASFTGSQGANWGYTATYNSKGEFYGGGISFNSLFPATTGVYQDTNAGQVDITINKFSSDGSSMQYATFCRRQPAGNAA
ncbi:MAG: hypothetical protein U5L96_04705 [Owenweeksia sp.]|nr:hypothetical protein [Owenweeksia sp.]